MIPSTMEANDVHHTNPEQRPALVRAVSAKRIPKGSVSPIDLAKPSMLLPHNSPLRRLHRGLQGSSRRPSSAISAHSRIHQALHRSESEFVFSSKQSTVDGFLYSSRFEQNTMPRPATSQAKRRPMLHQHADGAGGSHTSALPTQSPHAEHGSDGDSEVRSKPPIPEPANASKYERKLRALALQRRRKEMQQNEDQQAAKAKLDAQALTTKFDEASFIQRKRRCARTFEEMILARIQLENNASERSEHGMERLLENGIVHSVLSLCSVMDSATQGHCCRALFYLSQVPSARKSMVTHGIIATSAALARSVASKSRQDIAAALCHLSEEHGIVEAMLFEGMDRVLSRLLVGANNETKRICALAVFNISWDASKIKQMVDAFSQLLITTTKAVYGNVAASTYLVKAVYNVTLSPMFHAALLGENIPRFLASQLPNVTDDIKILALQALVSLCDVKANRMQIMSQAFCKLLEHMLGSLNREVQETTLLVLLLLSTDECNRIRLCNWVPTGVIVQAATIHLEDARGVNRESILVYLDSCIFRNLCDSILTHHELVEENVVDVLFQMSRLSDSDIKSNSVSALCSIIASSAGDSAEYVVPILDELILLTRSSHSGSCVFAISAIFNISCTDECLQMLIQSEALIARVLELSYAPPHAHIAELTAAIICRLANAEDSQPDLLERGFLSALIHLVRNFPVARPYAVNALYLMAQDGGDTFPHGDEIIWNIMAAISQEQPKTAPSDEISVARSAVTLTAYLAQQLKNHSLLVKHGAVFRFLSQLRRLGDEGDETIVLNATLVFYLLTATQEGCEQLIREKGIEELTHLMRATKLDASNSQRVKKNFMMAMCRISSFVGLEVRLIERGAVDAVMVLALVTTDSPIVKALCVKTLANCLVAKHCTRPLIEHGVIWALSSLAVTDSSETQHACAVSLCNLATVPSMLARFLDAGAPRALMHLLQNTPDPATILVVVKAIANLVANEKLCLSFMNEDIEKHLGAHFCNAQSSVELRQLAAMVLLRVTSANDAMLSVENLKRGTFVWMEQIISMEDAALVRNCMLTVHDLTCSTTVNVPELDIDYILRIMIQVFHRHNHRTEVLTLCLRIVYNLSCQLEVLNKLVHPEIMAFIRRQVPVVPNSFLLHVHTSPLEQPEWISIASDVTTDALLESTTASSTCALPRDSKHLNVAISKANQDIKLSCLILHNISCTRESMTSTTTRSSSANILASLTNSGAIEILCDIYSQRDDLLEICVSAVCNIAIGRVNTARIVDEYGGALLIHFTASQVVPHSQHRLVSVAMRKLTNAPGNQPRLLASGIVRAIVTMIDKSREDLLTIRNFVAALSLLSKCRPHAEFLLQDGVLPAVIGLCDVTAATGPGASSDILGYCFEILSNLCTLQYEPYVDDHDKINVVTTLTRLSELHPLYTVASTPSVAASKPEYYERGDRKPLPFAKPLTAVMKTPSSSSVTKKNLELQSTFQVASRKWCPQEEPLPHEPPPLECNEVPLTEGNQSIPQEIQQRIRNLALLPKDRLVRDESHAADDHSGTSSSTQGETPETVVIAATSKFDAFRKRSTPSKRLQRGNAGRHFSRTIDMASSQSLLP